ncbi:MAG: NHLP bacteriocin system secretion protein [Deltaproteobacteria bacterium]|nr:NHLP bacteriocin system secretion protein [Deltaproteobacteria bacterium]
MFREAALSRLRSPERTDEPPALPPLQVRIVGLGLALLAAMVLSWGIGGRIPEIAAGGAVLVTRSSIRPVQVRAGGQLERWLVGVGDRVQQGQLLGTLAQPVLEQQLAHARQKLLEVESRNVDLGSLRVRYLDLERGARLARAARLKQRIVELEEYIEQSSGQARRIKDLLGRTLRAQKQGLVVARQAAEQTTQALQQRLESYERLQQEKLASDDQVASARRSHEDSKLKAQEIALRGEELELSRIQMLDACHEAERRLRARQDEVARLRLDLLELEQQQARSAREEQESEQVERGEAEELLRSIHSLELRLSQGRDIRAEQDGRVLELSVAQGAVVRVSERVAMLDTSQQGDPLVALAFFPVATGKRIQPGMPVRIAPSTVDSRVDGSLLGTVHRVSPYPVSTEAVAAQLGSALARELIRGGQTIEVEVELLRAPTTFSGYRWTSAAGARQRFTAGTRAVLSLTLEQRRPFSYLLPLARAWLGLST